MSKQQKRERIFLIAAILFVVIVVVYTSITQSGDSLEDTINVWQNETEEIATEVTDVQEEELEEYTFFAVNDEEKIWGTHKICDIYDLMEYDKSPLAYGQMLTLFGEPMYTTENLENQYSYVISATNKEGNVTYLNVYSGPTGPSIGGNDGDEEIAKLLVEYIREAKATDYDYEGYYMDVPCKVLMGVKKGEPYMTEEILNLSDEEFSKMYNELYGLE